MNYRGQTITSYRIKGASEEGPCLRCHDPCYSGERAFEVAECAPLCSSRCARDLVDHVEDCEASEDDYPGDYGDDYAYHAALTLL